MNRRGGNRIGQRKRLESRCRFGRAYTGLPENPGGHGLPDRLRHSAMNSLPSGVLPGVAALKGCGLRAGCSLVTEELGPECFCLQLLCRS